MLSNGGVNAVLIDLLTRAIFCRVTLSDISCVRRVLRLDQKPRKWDTIVPALVSSLRALISEIMYYLLAQDHSLHSSALRRLYQAAHTESLILDSD